MPIDTDELREVVARADRHDAEGGVGAHREKTVGHLVHGAVAADGDDVARAALRRPRRQRHGVAGPLGAFDVHRPTLGAQGAAHGIESAERRAAARRGIEDDMGVTQARRIYPTSHPLQVLFSPIDLVLLLATRALQLPPLHWQRRVRAATRSTAY